jgi:antagonist of KipI
MADHQTAGGYPVPTVVCRADLSLAAQLLPGDSVSFQQITVDEAQRRQGRLREALDSLKSGE